MDRKYIVFGRNIGNTLGQIRSFGEAGLNPILVWIGDPSPVLRSCKYLSESYEFASINEAIDFILDKWGGRIKHIISVDSDGLVAELNRQYRLLSKHFYFFNAGEDNRLNKYMKKEELCKLANKYGLLTPSSEIVNVGEYPRNITYPLLTKAADSFSATWKTCVKICHTKEDLTIFYNKINNDVQQLLIQNYIDKKNEFVLQGISINNGKDILIPIEGSYIRIKAGYYGTFLIFQGITQRGATLIEPIRKMIEEIGYNGVFEVEFIIDKDDNYIFLEINFRHTLWNHAFSNMGLNFCKIWSDASINGFFSKINSVSNKQKHLLIHEFVDFLWYVKTGKINIFKWTYDFLRANSHVI